MIKMQKWIQKLWYLDNEYGKIYIDTESFSKMLWTLISQIYIYRYINNIRYHKPFKTQFKYALLFSNSMSTGSTDIAMTLYFVFVLLYVEWIISESEM